MKTLKASDFKTHCLSILDEVSETGASVIITKHGKVIAELRPRKSAATESPQSGLKGTVRVIGDLTKPVIDTDDLLLDGDLL